MDYLNRTCNDLFNFLISKILEFEKRKAKGPDD